jgi:hypothetical protein
MRAAVRGWALKARLLFPPFEARRCDCRTRHSPPPNLRTHVTPAVLDYWRELGWTCHVVGRAVYAHSPDGHHHLLVGCWSRREPRPAWADRLGYISLGYERRQLRCWHEQAWRREARDERGRFLAALPWWRWGRPVVYRWEGQP